MSEAAARALQEEILRLDTVGDGVPSPGEWADVLWGVEGIDGFLGLAPRPYEYRISLDDAKGGSDVTATRS